MVAEKKLQPRVVGLGHLPDAVAVPAVIVVHLTSDLSAIDHPEHVEHKLVRLDYPLVRAGVRPVVTAVCSCNERFELSGAPKVKQP